MKDTSTRVPAHAPRTANTQAQTLPVVVNVTYLPEDRLVLIDDLPGRKKMWVNRIADGLPATKHGRSYLVRLSDVLALPDKPAIKKTTLIEENDPTDLEAARLATGGRR